MRQSNEFAPGYGWVENNDGDVVVPDEADFLNESSRPTAEYNGSQDMPVEAPLEAAEPHGGEALPIAVDLRARAFALESLMAYYNQLNKARGASTQRQLRANQFDERYRSEASRVETNMYGKLDQPTFERNIEILTAADALRANGVDEDVVELEKITLKSKLNRQYGPHNAYAPDRLKLVKTVQKTAGMKPTRRIRNVSPKDSSE